MSHVLDGVRILDAGTVLASPGAAGLLADFGAEVIKIEQPGSGDPVRRYPPHADGQSLTSKVTNRGKSSVTLNLGDERGRDIFRELVKVSDVVVMNYRPSTLRKWSLDYEDLAELRPDVVMLHMTGYGRTGPYSDRPGFARVAEAYVGLTYMTGYPDRAPVPAGYAVADALGGVYGAFSVMLALYHRRMTGAGQLIDLSLYEGMMRVMDGLYIGYDVAGRIPERVGTINPGIAPHDIYPLGDGTWVSLPMSTQNMFTRLCAVLGVPEVADDPRFATNLERVEHREALDALLRPRLAELKAEDFLAAANSAGVATSRINNVADFVADEHVRERGSLVRIWDENLGREVLMQSVFPILSKSPGAIRWPGREPGQDNEYVLKELLSISDETFVELQVAGVI